MKMIISITYIMDFESSKYECRKNNTIFLRKKLMSCTYFKIIIIIIIIIIFNYK